MTKGFWFTPFKSDIPTGTEIHKFPGYYDLGGWSAQRETIFEQIRQSEFPGRPSRVGNVFICPDYKSAIKWTKGENFWRIFEVEYSGKAFRTDAYYWNEAYRDVMDEAARLYWLGTKNGGKYPELIIEGSVKVVRELDSWEDKIKRKRYKKLYEADKLGAFNLTSLKIKILASNVLSLRDRVKGIVQDLQQSKKVPLKIRFRFNPIPGTLAYRLILSSLGDLTSKFDERSAMLSIAISVANLTNAFKREKLNIRVSLDHNLEIEGQKYVKEWNSRTRDEGLNELIIGQRLQNQGNVYKYAQYVKDVFDKDDIYTKHIQDIRTIEKLPLKYWGPFNLNDLDRFRMNMQGSGYRVEEVRYKGELYIILE